MTIVGIQVLFSSGERLDRSSCLFSPSRCRRMLEQRKWLDVARV